jgi:hypothetical protein
MTDFGWLNFKVNLDHPSFQEGDHIHNFAVMLDILKEVLIQDEAIVAKNVVDEAHVHHHIRKDTLLAEAGFTLAKESLNSQNGDIYKEDKLLCSWSRE